jgi:serine/threonine protein phosphatase 1
MTSTVYAIGDVHGRADLLSSLVDFISEHARSNCKEPRVFFLGDIVDRGPDSREAMEIVCETLRRWPQSRLLLGNHDQLFLDAMTSQIYVEKWFADFGGVKTLASFLGEGTHYWPDEITSIGERFPELLSVLGNAPTILPVGRYVFVHAGIDPSVPVTKQNRNVLLQIRTKFTDHVGLLSHIIVHGHSIQDPPQPVVTENRISLDTNAWQSGILSMAVIDTETDVIEFFAAGPDGNVSAVKPVRLDRGFGTVLDEAHPIWIEPELHSATG